MPLLGLAARQAAGVWGTLAEFKVGFPPAAPGATKESGKSKSRVSLAEPKQEDWRLTSVSSRRTHDLACASS